MKVMMYESLLAQMKALVEGESEEVSVLSNASALIKAATGFFWVGFYMVRPAVPVKPQYCEEELRLGPFQGSVACYSIGYGKGVCGTAWKEERSVVVPDVEEFPGHIACSSLSRSEIVVPLMRGGKVMGVLDIDSTETGTFDEVDRIWLEKICEIISSAIFGNK